MGGVGIRGRAVVYGNKGFGRFKSCCLREPFSGTLGHLLKLRARREYALQLGDFLLPGDANKESLLPDRGRMGVVGYKYSILWVCVTGMSSMLCVHAWVGKLRVKAKEHVLMAELLSL